MSFELGDYVDVPSRIAEFREKHPDGSLQPADLAVPYRVEAIGEQTFVVVVAAAYRSPDDQRPGVGMAYEQFPGKTPYTKGSELQNAETSAWGRAIVAVLAADAKRGVASQEDIRNRRAEREPAAAADPAGALRAQIGALAKERGWSLAEIATGFASDYDQPIGEGKPADLEAYLAFLREQP